MKSKYVLALVAIGWILFGPSSEAIAQEPRAIFDKGTVTILFLDNFRGVDKEKLAASYLFFEDSGGNLKQIRSNARADKGTNFVIMDNFRIDKDSVDLARGGGNVTAIPARTTRTYTIVLKGVQLPSEAKAKDKQISVEVTSAVSQLPQIFMFPIKDASNIEYDRRVFIVQPFGLNTERFLNMLKAHPEKIRISYKFSKTDLSAIDINTYASSIERNPDSADNLLIKPARELPRRPEKYSVAVTFPAQELTDAILRDSEKPPDVRNINWEIPPDVAVLETGSVANLIPPKVDRASSLFYFETTYTSGVNPKDGKRSNVGVFGIHVKPTLPILTYNVYGTKGENPVWMAFRPLLEADFDTQPIKASKSPNRIVFGMDYELGRDAGLQTAEVDPITGAQQQKLSPLQQLIWINGIRYDSDRDFKLQTLYWHTELIPRFLNFEQTQERRQYLYQIAIQNLKNVERREPIVSSYRVRPSIGYELGGIVKRDLRQINFPTEKISRLLVGLDMGIEFRRVISLSLLDTYYFLENAPRRRNRNYLEARFDLNTGYLFNIDLAGLQNAITFKFQRGDQPPTFGPVNVFSVGFKIFQ